MLNSGDNDRSISPFPCEGCCLEMISAQDSSEGLSMWERDAGSPEGWAFILKKIHHRRPHYTQAKGGKSQI